MKYLVALLPLLVLLFAVPVEAHPVSSITTTYNFAASLNAPAVIDFNTLSEGAPQEISAEADFKEKLGTHYGFTMYQLQLDNSWLLLRETAYTGRTNHSAVKMILGYFRELGPSQYQFRFTTDNVKITTGTIAVTHIGYPLPPP